MVKEKRQAMWKEPLLKEISKEGVKAYSLPKLEEEIKKMEVLDKIPKNLLRAESGFLPEISEPQIVEHYTRLDQLTYGVYHGFYPHGSCTMKYNPVINEKIGSLEKALYSHPLQDESFIQGSLKILHLTKGLLKEISGFHSITLQPAAGAQGEMLGMLLAKNYHKWKGEEERNEIIIPDSAHGTNPASAKAMLGYDVITLPSNEEGRIDLEILKAVVHDEKTAGIMVTNPNTLGIFEKDIVKLGEIVHKAGGVVYIDGANLNALMGISKPGEWFNGPTIMHFNLHKTFSTPHGGGGPGAGPVGVSKELEPFLPIPRIEKKSKKYFLNYNKPLSIGKVKNYYGNFGVILKACSYILSMGGEGLKSASKTAVLNANYLMKKLDEIRVARKKEVGEWEFIKPFELEPKGGVRKHEFVLSAKTISALHFCKRMLDFGVQTPIMYFPTIVKEALMIEPTETVSKKTLDDFVEIMEKISDESVNDKEKLILAPHNMGVSAVDERSAGRKAILSWEEYKKKLLKE